MWEDYGVYEKINKQVVDHYDEIIEEMKEANRASLLGAYDTSLAVYVTDDGIDYYRNEYYGDDYKDKLHWSMFFDFKHFYHGIDWYVNEDIMTGYEDLEDTFISHADEKAVAEYEAWVSEHEDEPNTDEIVDWWEKHHPDVYEITENEFIDWACEHYTDYDSMLNDEINRQPSQFEFDYKRKWGWS